MELLDRVRALLPTAVEKRMFGGTGFMVDGALACSVSARGLLVRVGADAAGRPPGRRGRRADGHGRSREPRLGARRRPRSCSDDDALRAWVARGVAAARAAVSPGP